MKTMILATRGSKLALTQSRWVKRQVEKAHPQIKVELSVIKTQGDLNQTDSLSSFSGKGIFTKEVEVALLEKKADFAVHSLKDLPTELPQGLTLSPPPQREDPRDVLISSIDPKELKEQAIVGTGSLRRQGQILNLFPQLQTKDIRGNVPTRVQKLVQGDYDAIVLAMAGVQRLGYEACGLTPEMVFPLEIQDFLCAPGQGILGLEYREDDLETKEVLQKIACPTATLQFRAERAFLAELEGSCNLPAGCYADIKEGQIHLLAGLAPCDQPQQWKFYRAQIEPKEAEKAGKKAAQVLKQKILS